MARVEDWFPEFTIAHQARLPRSDWPEKGTEAGDHYWSALKSNLRRSGATFDLADEASVRLSSDPPRFLDDQSKALLDMIAVLRKERLDPGVGFSLDDRESAVLAAIGCPDCGPAKPSGFATRWRHEPLEPRQDRTVSFFCLCSMGRWTKAAHEKATKSGKLLFFDMKDHPFLWRGEVSWSLYPDNKHCYPPDSWDEVNDRPYAAVDEPARPAELLDFCRSFVASTHLPKPTPPQVVRESSRAALAERAKSDPAIARELAPVPSPSRAGESKPEDYDFIQ